MLSVRSPAIRKQCGKAQGVRDKVCLHNLVISVPSGGPGESGISQIQALAVYASVTPQLPQAVLERFDVVSWDPRGVGLSRGVACFDDTPSQQSEVCAVHAVRDVRDVRAC